MSRCFPFPPPGYIKNAPVELELSSKKEKRKHKKKKKKRHSATNGDHTTEDGDRRVEQSGVPKDGFSVGIEALPSATVSQGAIPRLQTESSGDEAFSNGVRLTDPKREEKRFKSKKDLPSSSIVAAQRLPKDGFSLGIEALPLATVSQGAIPRLQTESSGDEAFSNGVCSMDSKREEKRMKSKKDLPSSSVVAAQRLQAGPSGANVPSNVLNGIMGVQSQEGMTSMMEVLKNDDLARGHKRLRVVDSSRLGSHLASGHKRPEEGEDSVFSNGVLSTKRKRLQADNSGDILLPKSPRAADCKRSNGLPAGRSKSNVFLHATNSTTLKADNICKTLVSKDGLPFNSERPEQRTQVDDLRIKVATDVACSTIGPAEIGKAREMPSRCLANKRELQGEESKLEVQSKGAMSSRQIDLQADSSKVRPPMNGMLTAKCDGPDKRQQTGKKLLMNNVRDSRVSVSPANTLNERMMLSGSSLAGSSESVDQRIQGTNKVVLNGLSNAKVKQSEADNDKGLVDSHGVQAISEQRLHMDSSQHNVRASVVLDKKIQADTTCNLHGMLATSYGHFDKKLQAYSSRNGVLINGVIAAHPERLGQPKKVRSYPSSPGRSEAGHREELNQPIKVGGGLSSPGRNASNDTATPKITTAARKSSFEFEEQSIKERLMKLRIPHGEQLWVTGEDDDWLKSCKQQVQLKQREEGADQMLQVWAEGVLLPAVGVTALPYVIPN